MLNKAIEKIKKEMDQNKGNQYIQVIGNFLLQHINTNPGAAEKIMTEGKTISNSLDEMKNVARKKATTGFAMLTDQESFEIVLKYFGINDKPAKFETPKEFIEVVKPVAKRTDFNISLDDLL